MLLSPCWRRLSGHQCITLTCYYSLSSRKPDFRAWHCYWGPGWEGLRRKVDASEGNVNTIYGERMWVNPG